MNPLKTLDPKFLQPNQAEAISPDSPQIITTKPPLKKLRGSFLVLLGYALSPLCWWNDLVFNLPIAYGFGYLWSIVSPNFLIPGAIAGYWLSNVVGILLMQAGLLDVMQGQNGERNLKKELLTGVMTSTLYTAGIVLLLHFKILETPLFSFNP
jgi:hypothetical protein